MRPVANFTLHAILAAALAALASTSAAAGGPALLTLGTESGGGPQAAASDKPRIAVLELMAFEWGTAADSINLGSWAKADGLAVSWDVPGSASRGLDAGMKRLEAQDRLGDAARSSGGSNRMAMDDSAGREKLQPGGGSSGAGASGLPTGKRQHKPFSLATPLDKGSVWIRVASPWADCRVGKRYPSLAISDGTRNYRLLGATVAGCGRTAAAADRPVEEVAFTYSKISF